jgi:hypothetical protein
MKSCEQSSGQTILEHGEAVSQAYKDLIGPQSQIAWRLPDWFKQNHEWMISQCPSLDIMEAYHLFHDVGKCECRELDVAGNPHFQNHALISARTWLVAGGSQQVGTLIERDMDMHLLKPSRVQGYNHFDLVPALLLTALSEIHANAKMFGGIESTSFKIKWKALDRLGTTILRSLCSPV